MPGHHLLKNINGSKFNNTKLCRVDSKRATEPPNWTVFGTVALGTYLMASSEIYECGTHTQREHLC